MLGAGDGRDVGSAPTHGQMRSHENPSSFGGATPQRFSVSAVGDAVGAIDGCDGLADGTCVGASVGPIVAPGSVGASLGLVEGDAVGVSVNTPSLQHIAAAGM